ncbi:MAG: replicative DNA helicase [Deltaproteobacteria bacterium]|nr:replicative DNA helicase [Deltaproteobacteria bacterium]
MSAEVIRSPAAPVIQLPPGRVPPQNLDAERSVLGGILLDNQSLNDVLEVVKPEDFYREAHRKVYEAMISLFNKNEPVDRITVKDALTQQGLFEAVGGDDFIDLLDKIVPSASNLGYYARIVREKAIARRLIEAAQAIQAQGFEQAGDIAEFLDEAERRIFAVTEQKAQTGFAPVREVVRDAFKLLQNLYERQEEITGIATGFSDLDRMTSGFQPGDLVLLAARPSMGKTAFALNIATHVGCRAKFNGKKCGVAIFSLEMPKEQLVMRMLSSEARVDAQRIRTGRLVESDWSKLAHAAGVLAEANIVIDDSPGVGALDLRAKCRRLAAKNMTGEAPLGLIIIDYLQLMKGNERIESREQQISEISRSLKGLAKELKVPVIALSQLNRSLEKRPDKRPVMSDLRESGAIEQDADTICFLYREEVYEKDKEDVRGVAEVIVGKQRNGPIGMAPVAFLHEFTRFENLAREYTPSGGE